MWAKIHKTLPRSIRTSFFAGRARPASTKSQSFFAPRSSLLVGGKLARAAVGVFATATAVGCLALSSSNQPALNDKKPAATRKWHFYSGQHKGSDLQRTCIFTGNANRPLAEEICRYLGLDMSKSVVSSFSDGEINIKIEDNVRGRDVFIIQPVCAPVNDNLVELLLMTSAMKRASANSITAVVPYYGYARQDRKMISRVPISAADVASMMETMGVDRLIAVDLHSAQIQGFFSPRVPVDNILVGKVGSFFFSEKDLHNPVVVSPDGGGVPRAKAFRDGLLMNGHPDTDLAMLVEQRVTDESGHFTKEFQQVDLVGNVQDCDCIIVEDIIDTGFTICRAAQELKKAGASRVFVFAPHGLFTGDAVDNISSAPLDEVVVTNTVPLPPHAANVDKIKQLTVAPLLAETIYRVATNRSLSTLFERPIDKPKEVTIPEPTKELEAKASA